MILSLSAFLHLEFHENIDARFSSRTRKDKNEVICSILYHLIQERLATV